jgi:ABC-type amino acid transport substrate-binding protein
MKYGKVNHRFIVFLVFAGLMFFYGTGGGLAGDLDELKQRGELRHLGIPYANFVTGTGDGLDVDLIKMFANHLGVRYTFVQTDWGRIIGDLSGKKVIARGDEVEVQGPAEIRGDLIANGLTQLAWREKAINYSRPTFPNQVWLIARAESPLQPIVPTGNIEADIQAVKKLIVGQTVLDMPNTCLDASLYQLSELGVSVTHFSGGLNDLAPALIEGKADLLLLDVADALVALEKWPQKIKVLGPLSERQNMGVGFAKSSPELLEAFNTFFQTINRNGVYQDMVRKYYPSVFVYYSDFFNQQ